MWAGRSAARGGRAAGEWAQLAQPRGCTVPCKPLAAWYPAHPPSFPPRWLAGLPGGEPAAAGSQRLAAARRRSRQIWGPRRRSIGAAPPSDPPHPCSPASMANMSMRLVIPHHGRRLARLLGVVGMSPNFIQQRLVLQGRWGRARGARALRARGRAAAHAGADAPPRMCLPNSAAPPARPPLTSTRAPRVGWRAYAGRRAACCPAALAHWGETRIGRRWGRRARQATHSRAAMGAARAKGWMQRAAGGLRVMPPYSRSATARTCCGGARRVAALHGHTPARVLRGWRGWRDGKQHGHGER